MVLNVKNALIIARGVRMRQNASSVIKGTQKLKTKSVRFAQMVAAMVA